MKTYLKYLGLTFLIVFAVFVLPIFIYPFIKEIGICLYFIILIVGATLLYNWWEKKNKCPNRD